MSARQKRIRTAVILLTAIILAGIVFSFSSNREPRYHGQSLTYWYQEYCRPLTGANAIPGPARRAEALEALKNIGTNALPYLVEMTFSTNRDSSARSNMVSFANGLRRFWNLREMPTSEQLHREASSLIRGLKPPASALIPLLQTFSHTTNLATNSVSLYLLGGVGDGAGEAVPYLAAALKQPSLPRFINALESIELLGAAARPAVPALVEYLEALKGTNFIEDMLVRIPAISTNNLARAAASFKDRSLYFAARALGSIGPDAAPAVPLLQEFLKTRTNEPTRTELAFALCRIDPGQTNALGFLVASIGSTTYWSTAVQHLGELGTNALAAAPALLEAVRRPNLAVQLQAARALNRIGVPPKEYLPAIKANLASNSSLAQFGAAAQVMAIDPSDRDALQFLIRNATENSPLRFSAVRELANAGPAAKDAIPALRELLKSIDPRLRGEAAEALRIIEAKEPPK